MKRKQAILGILGITAGTAATYAGWQWYRLQRKPDLSKLAGYKPLVDALTETILPATPGIPGAKQAGVGEFVIKMIQEATSPIEQNKFMEGLDSIHQKSNTRFQKKFESLTPSQQYTLLQEVMRDQTHFKGILGKVQNKFLGKTFFQLLKTLTVTGYCTSELGAQQGLAYQYLPGTYQGCMPLNAQQKAWSTK